MTALFWSLAAVLAVLALVVLLLPLARRARYGDVDRASLNVAIHEGRLKELERDRQLGSLSEEEFQTSREELERALLEDATATGPAPGGTGGSYLRTPTLVGLLLLIPAAAVVLYMNLGQPRMLTASAGDPPATGNQVASAEEAPSLDEMVGRLEERLVNEPDNLEGWVMLGRTYQVMQRHGDAVEAFQKARALAPNDPEVNVRYAEALALTRNGNLQGEPETVIQDVLSQNSRHPLGLWLAGLAAQQRGENEEALTYWNRLRPMLEGEERTALERMIAEAGGSVPAAPAAAPEAAPMPPAPAAAGPGEAAEVAEGGSLRVRVAMGDALAADAEPSDTVFIFARAAQGPRMPLAVVRRTVADLPLSVELDDSQAMTAQFRLSNFPQVVVGARVSRSGQPTPQEGDLEGMSEAVTPGRSDPVQVTIDRRI